MMNRDLTRAQADGQKMIEENPRYCLTVNESFTIIRQNKSDISAVAASYAIGVEAGARLERSRAKRVKRKKWTDRAFINDSNSSTGYIICRKYVANLSQKLATNLVPPRKDTKQKTRANRII